jgi:hypothetical protein
MITAAVLFGFLVAQSVPDRSSYSDEFASSHAVIIDVYEGRCRYWLTHVGLDASQLREILSEDYEAARGLEVLKVASTPAKCVRLAKRAASRAGFKKVRVRLQTANDRVPPLP